MDGRITKPRGNLKFLDNQELKSIEDSKSKKMENTPIEIKFAACTLAGRYRDGSQKQNQDHYAFLPSLGNLRHARLFMICDGHGKYGAEIACAVTHLFPHILAPKLERVIAQHGLNSGTVDSLSIAFREATREVNQTVITGYFDSGMAMCVDAGCSGTTICASILVGNHLLTMNVGDTRSVLAMRYRKDPRKTNHAPSSGSPTRRGSRSDSESPTSTPCPVRLKRLTCDHRVHTNEDERARIERAGGIVGRSAVGIEPELVRRSALRIWLPADFSSPESVLLPDLTLVAVGKDMCRIAARGPGLSLSRSIGDKVAGLVGVTCNPVVDYHLLQEGRDKAIVMGSDGLWAFSDAQEIVELATDCDTDRLHDCAKRICYLARREWDTGSRRTKIIDDITVLIIRLWPESCF